jgi:cob(I)alamin adenosyltransferase
VHLHELVPVPAVTLQYLNRLSDWLFVFSRMMTHLTASQEIAWTPRNTLIHSTLELHSIQMDNRLG